MEIIFNIFKSNHEFDLIPVKLIPEYRYGEVYYNLGVFNDLLDSDIIYSSTDLMNWYKFKDKILKNFILLRYAYYSSSIESIKLNYLNLCNKLENLNIEIDEYTDLQLIEIEDFKSKLYYISLGSEFPEYFLVKS